LIHKIRILGMNKILVFYERYGNSSSNSSNSGASQLLFLVVL
jgi:hypothetical protein